MHRVERVEIMRVERVKENIRISAEDSLGLQELKQHKPSFIYYALCESLQGTRPIGYRVCHSIITILLWVHCITLTTASFRVNSCICSYLGLYMLSLIAKSISSLFVCE